MLYTFADIYQQWYILLSIEDCFNIADSKLIMLKFKCLRVLLSIIISAAVTVMQCTLNLVVSLINTKITESFLLTVIINLFKSLSEPHITFLITIKSQPHSVSSEVNILTKIIIKTISSAKTELLTAV